MDATTHVTLLGQECLELLLIFARSEKFDGVQTLRKNSQQHATGCASGCNI